ncbi:phosphonate C-P lyase system protein PhnG [Litoreibacter sp.]|nr:phosphonate C-P lyase system protein PhnG [Litoreibacter sp.]
MTKSPNPNTARRNWMGLLAKAPPEQLSLLWTDLGLAPQHDFLRAPEIGSVMVRGRMGAIGAGFNLGEMTVTRCSVRLQNGTDGHAYVQGRDKNKALQAALIDGLMQTDAAKQVQHAILTPLHKSYEAKKAKRAAKAAATKVDFFTMVRGED